MSFKRSVAIFATTATLTATTVIAPTASALEVKPNTPNNDSCTFIYNETDVQLSKARGTFLAGVLGYIGNDDSLSLSQDSRYLLNWMVAELQKGKNPLPQPSDINAKYEKLFNELAANGFDRKEVSAWILGASLYAAYSTDLTVGAQVKTKDEVRKLLEPATPTKQNSGSKLAEYIAKTAQAYSLLLGPGTENQDAYKECLNAPVPGLGAGAIVGIVAAVIGIVTAAVAALVAFVPAFAVMLPAQILALLPH